MAINKNYIGIFLIFMTISCRTSQPTVRTTKPEIKSKKVFVKIPNHSTNNSDEIKTNKIETLEATTTVKVTTEMVLAYIQKYKDIAKSDMKKYGIPASITLAQAILESGAGTGPLSVQANNHFGIKCHKDWTGPSIKHDDDSTDECFRKYENPYQSFDDHSSFLANRPRYSSLFKLKKDNYTDWAIGLKNAGYATDPKYPDKLIGLIERYQLNQYDSEILGSTNSLQENNSIVNNDNLNTDSNSYIVLPKDTLYSISKKFNLTVDELKNINHLTENSLSIGQILKIK